MRCSYCDEDMFQWGSCYECIGCGIRFFDLEGGRIYQVWVMDWCALPSEGLLIVRQEVAL